MTPLRVTAVLTHPVQYYGAWFRYLHAHVPSIRLTVLYAIEPTRDQQGVGFGQAFAWDVPPRDGYESTVVRQSQPADSVASDTFFGVDAPTIGRDVLATSPDVVVVFGWYSIALLRAVRAARRAGIPVLWRGDTNLHSAPNGWRRSLWQARTRALLRWFDGFLAVGTRTETYLRYFGVADERIARAPHVVDSALFEPALTRRADPQIRAALRQSLGLDPHAWVACFVGKLEDKKRPLDVIRAVARIGDATVLLAGAGPLADEVRTEADRLNVRMVATGFVNQRGLADVYAAADVLVLPSDGRETWGLVVNEALAAGLPCVVSQSVGAAADMITTHTGARVPCGEIAPLADALSAVRGRQRAGHDYAPACRAMAARHSFAAASHGLVSLAHRVCEDGRGASRANGRRVVALCGSMVLVGGLERMTFEILRSLRQQSAAIHVIVNGWDNRRIVELADQVGASWSTGYYWHRVQVPQTVRNALWLFREVVQTSGGLLRDAWRFRATHILVPDPWTVLRNIPVLLLLRAAGRDVILRMGVAAPASRTFQRMLRWAIAPCVTRIVCNSRFTASTVTDAGVAPRKVTVIPNVTPSRGSEEPVISEPQRGRVVYIGQIFPGKGVDRLLDAIGILRARGVDASLDVVGDMDDWEPPEYNGYRARLRARAARPDLDGQVRFVGWQDDVASWLSQAAVHCCPSLIELREGFGIVVLEAKAAGVPSVVTPSGALGEAIDHGRNGWVCRDDSPEAIAEGLAAFLENSEQRDAAAASARASADRYDRAHFAQAWTTVFA